MTLFFPLFQFSFFPLRIEIKIKLVPLFFNFRRVVCPFHLVSCALFRSVSFNGNQNYVERTAVFLYRESRAVFKNISSAARCLTNGTSVIEVDSVLPSSISHIQRTKTRVFSAKFFF